MILQSEFPDYPVESLPKIPPGFKASHWHNDACPSWTRDDLQLFIDYPDKNRSEVGGPRFSLHRTHGAVVDEIISTDVWEAVLAAIANEDKKRIGARVRFVDELHQYPHFMVPAHATGTVVESWPEYVGVKCDAPIAGCEEWANVVHVDPSRQHLLVLIEPTGEG